MFFLLSSYLITKLLILERESTGSIHIKSFYIRRILRIWPLYLTFLMGMWGLGRFHVFYPIETGRLLAFLLFAGNIYSGVFGFTFNPILPLWTISIEEQFYIVWPALARAAWVEAGAWSILGIAITSTILLHRTASNPSLALWTSSLVQFQFFALGALVALHFSNRSPDFTTAARFAMALTSAMLLMVAAGPFHINRDGPSVTNPLLTIGYELMALGILLLFLAVLGSTRGGSQIPRSLTYLGKISYGLYVFHELALQICKAISLHFSLPPGFRAVGAACLTLLLASLSYRYFEKPFLVLKDRFALVATRPM